MPHAIRVIAGKRLSVIYRLSYQWRLKRSREEARNSNFGTMIRVVLPHHLRTLAKVGDEVQVDINGSATVKSLLDALENKYPMLRGTIRDHGTLKRRPLVRFFVCGEDISHESPDT